MIYRQVVADLEEPGGKLVGGIVAAEIVQRPDERLLGQVLRQLPVPHHPEDEREDRTFEPEHDLARRPFIAAEAHLHQRLLAVIRVAHSILPLRVAAAGRRRPGRRRDRRGTPGSGPSYTAPRPICAPKAVAGMRPRPGAGDANAGSRHRRTNSVRPARSDGSVGRKRGTRRPRARRRPAASEMSPSGR